VRDVQIRCPPLVIGLRLCDGVVTVRLVGVLDRGARAALLRAVPRAVRAGSGDVVVDCAGLEAHDEAGVDALLALSRRPGVRSVRLRHVDPDLGRQLDVAGLAGRLLAPEPA
jgi:anti-anti-sigma regulatory factor